MYVDKPMRGHGLMQAIARVNRVFKDKPGGLVVDYLGLAAGIEAGARDLHRERRHAARRRIDQAEAVALMLEKYEVCCGMLPRLRLVALDVTGDAGSSKLSAAAGGAGAHPGAGGRQRTDFVQGRDGTVARHSRWPCRTTRRLRIRDDVGFFQAVRAVLAKSVPGDGASPTRTSTTPSGRSSPAPCRRTR